MGIKKQLYTSIELGILGKDTTTSVWRQLTTLGLVVGGDVVGSVVGLTEEDGAELVVGLPVGDTVGLTEGLAEGAGVGLVVGDKVGLVVGLADGDTVGDTVGLAEGA